MEFVPSSGYSHTCLEYVEKEDRSSGFVKIYKAG